MDTTQLQSLFDWGRCQNCMMVSEGWDPTAYTSAACPGCGEVAFGQEWPPEPARLLLRQAFSGLPMQTGQPDTPHDTGMLNALDENPRVGAMGEDQSVGALFHDDALEDRKDGRDSQDQELTELLAVKAFLVATSLDVMLEWVFRAAAESFDSDSLEVARLVEPRYEATLTTEQRLDLLREVTGLKIRDLAEDQNEPQFPGWWKELGAKRDRFLHAADMTAFGRITEEELRDVARMGTKVLGALNNALWQG